MAATKATMNNEPMPAKVRLTEGLGPLGEPLFLLHTGALFGNERDEWEVEANSQAAVDELAEAQPLGTTLNLYALTPEDVAAVNATRKDRASKALRRLDLCECDHNEYCRHCFPVEFRPGGMWGGPNAKAHRPEGSGAATG